MKDLGITPGDWIADEDDVYSNASIIGTIVCEAPEYWDESMVFWEKNAKLISDAGTTANKCGLLPSELLAQRDELMKALKGLLKTIPLGFINEHTEFAKYAIEKATE